MSRTGFVKCRVVNSAPLNETFIEQPCFLRQPFFVQKRRKFNRLRWSFSLISRIFSASSWLGGLRSFATHNFGCFRGSIHGVALFRSSHLLHFFRKSPKVGFFFLLYSGQLFSVIHLPLLHPRQAHGFGQFDDFLFLFFFHDGSLATSHLLLIELVFIVISNFPPFAFSHINDSQQIGLSLCSGQGATGVVNTLESLQIRRASIEFKIVQITFVGCLQLFVHLLCLLLTSVHNHINIFISNG
mmetsp:Transcript_14953/g.23556  ORF Transcript_14953/g.23556 Transcript_14953/m.23556 type:complete len:242 (-) Transcript_14953:1232-1957(-)